LPSSAEAVVVKLLMSISNPFVKLIVMWDS